MPYAIDFLEDGRVLEWVPAASGAGVTVIEDYTPRFYVGGRSSDTEVDLSTLETVYEHYPDVAGVDRLNRKPGFRRDEEPVLAIDVDHVDRVVPLAQQARQLSEYPVGDLACFNVDFSREFRYCLENGIDPTPTTDLSTLRLSVPVTETSKERYSELSVAGDTITGSPEKILARVQTALEDYDPDLL